ncbi:sulfotransferase family protein [Pseudofrankia inefficax]|uniref:Sulfotransferase n=1 Tax=Pseudofrankia inefficax (strain DSM 45817 / CECT 9037 / DDB 130130 / EuI1c) TaxID=298654 RepID=E3J7Y2_PSEI1|nr:sulfotransferase [Pseudofrankia inefficax]ADP82030.1 sulfotransferase [Pseudofrankia inefficax]
MRDRLVQFPIFLLSPPRSGSTLLRCILDSHSRIHSPHELYLDMQRVKCFSSFGETSLKVSGLTLRGAEHLLWDRLLHRSLVASGKDIIVEKTPTNVYMWERIVECWPDARFIFLIRHPAAVAESAVAAVKSFGARDRLKYARDITQDAVRLVIGGHARDLKIGIEPFMTKLEAARQALPGRTVRYEDLATRPAEVMTDLCAFIGVDFEPAMLDYGAGRDQFVPGIGDWRDKIRSGRIQPPAQPPPSIPPKLRAVARAWGYLEPDNPDSTTDGRDDRARPRPSDDLEVAAEPRAPLVPRPRVGEAGAQVNVSSHGKAGPWPADPEHSLDPPPA